MTMLSTILAMNASGTGVWRNGSKVRASKRPHQAWPRVSPDIVDVII